MASESIVESFPSLSLSYSEPGSEYLRFNPPTYNPRLRKPLSRIPRYLFRVSTPISDGISGKDWAKSKDVKLSRLSGAVSVLAEENNHEVAIMLDKHLRGWTTPDDSDNLVSWTSSLLFALQYIFYRRANDDLHLGCIQLCILDTSSYPDGVFLQDMGPIDAYSPFDKGWRNLQDLKELRVKKHATYAGYFYLGVTRHTQNQRQVSNCFSSIYCGQRAIHVTTGL